MDATEPHLLVVDDDARLRDLLRRYLTDQGFRVTTAGDAAEARRKLDSIAFDLLVLDVMMPGEDGFALTTSLRASSRIPILLLTARAETADRIGGLERGADDYLTKPFEPRELVLRIRNILQRAAGEAERKAVLRLGEYRLDLRRGELRRGEES
ncbi:MAG: response regulator, partial [Alphaproteobacteria bacterium]|nr:response regulator [Alphaproteobacteria bacterium]